MTSKTARPGSAGWALDAAASPAPGTAALPASAVYLGAAGLPADATPHSVPGPPAPPSAPAPGGAGPTTSRPGRSRASGAGTGNPPGKAAGSGGRPEMQAPGRPGSGGDLEPPPLPCQGAPVALAGEEWRQAAKAALAKTRRKTTRPATASRQTPGPGVDTGLRKRDIAAGQAVGPTVPSAGLTATAHCLRDCDWTEGPGPAGDVDKAAEKHTSRPPKHPTNVIAELAGNRGAA